ncbi:Rnase Y domain-containing protein, partial [Mangrovimonas futianensis]
MATQTDYIKKLEQVSKMTADEAKKALLDEVQRDLSSEIAKKIRQAEE